MKTIAKLLLGTLIFLPGCGGRLPASVTSVSPTQQAVQTNTDSTTTANSPVQTLSPVQQTTVAYQQPQQVNPVYQPQQQMAAYNQAQVMPQQPVSVQIHPDQYANPYYPQGYGQRPATPVYPGQVYANAMPGAYPPNQAYPAAYTNQPRRAY